ncbi:MAG: hypothetical protein JWM95_157 [Gemmatimonadetes bacterium]|nr:hypothetical protein [Gemmatimonadota bacterium]
MTSLPTLSQVPRAPNTWQQRLYARAADWQVDFDIRVSATARSRDREAEAIKKVFAALALLRETSPYQLARLPVLMLGLTIRPLDDALGEWQRVLGVCFLDEAFVLAVETTAGDVASVIVHELTHARLESLGYSYEGESRARIERICFLAERNFALRLAQPDEREHLLERNGRYLSMSSSFWSDEAVSKREAAQRAARPLWLRRSQDLLRLVSRLSRTVPHNVR